MRFAGTLIVLPNLMVGHRPSRAEQEARRDGAGILGDMCVAHPGEEQPPAAAPQPAQPAQPEQPPDEMEGIDPEFIAALPPDIQAEVLEQQRRERRRRAAERQRAAAAQVHHAIMKYCQTTNAEHAKVQQNLIMQCCSHRPACVQTLSLQQST